MPIRKLPFGLAFCSMLICMGMLLTAAGASPLSTQNAQVGPYKVLLSFYSLPRAGQALSMTIESSMQGTQLHFSQAVLNPAKGTDANTVGVQLNPDKDNQNITDVNVTPPIRGVWLLHLTLQGTHGLAIGDVPITVDGPPAIPTWLGWLIGLLPLPILVAIIWLQVGWHKAKGDVVRQEILARPTF